VKSKQHQPARDDVWQSHVLHVLGAQLFNGTTKPSLSTKSLPAGQPPVKAALEQIGNEAYQAWLLLSLNYLATCVKALAAERDK
jgi:hypothetical protein